MNCAVEGRDHEDAIIMPPDAEPGIQKLTFSLQIE
jgi:hypothetical protein